MEIWSPLVLGLLVEVCFFTLKLIDTTFTDGEEAKNFSGAQNKALLLPAISLHNKLCALNFKSPFATNVYIYIYL